MSIRAFFGLPPVQPPLFNQDVRALALSSTGKVLCHGSDLGSAVLIGIDRVIVPLHLISGRCPEELTIQFSLSDRRQSTIFTVLAIFVIDQELDCAILQLASHLNGDFPGHLLLIPEIALGPYQGVFLLSSFNQNAPVVREGIGGPCGFPNFCSGVATEPGCSGGGYFNQSGELFAIHLARSSGRCGIPDSFSKKALFLGEVVQKYPEIFRLPICTPISHPSTQTCCAPPYILQNLCFTEEGKPAVHFTIRSGATDYPCWEWMPRNCQGEGPRGLTVAIPDKKEKLTYKFDPNPHRCSAYNKKQEELYTEAAKQFVQVYERTKELPQRFVFKAYGIEFTATLS